MQIMAGTPQMKLFTALLMDSIIANIMCSPFILFSGGMEGEKNISGEKIMKIRFCFTKYAMILSNAFFL